MPIYRFSILTKFNSVTRRHVTAWARTIRLQCPTTVLLVFPISMQFQGAHDQTAKSRKQAPAIVSYYACETSLPLRLLSGLATRSRNRSSRRLFGIWGFACDWRIFVIRCTSHRGPQVVCNVRLMFSATFEHISPVKIEDEYCTNIVSHSSRH